MKILTVDIEIDIYQFEDGTFTSSVTRWDDGLPVCLFTKANLPTMEEATSQASSDAADLINMIEWPDAEEAIGPYHVQIDIDASSREGDLL